MMKVDLARCQSLLRTERLGRPKAASNELWDTIDSTNTRAKQLSSENIDDDALAGKLIIARQQTAGRGRQGKTWASPPDSGLYVSMLLRSTERPLHELSLVTLAAGVAVSRAIKNVSNVTVGLKWVNDLICANRKIGGILAETTGGMSPYLVLGIGINVNLGTENLPDELQTKVTSLHEHTDGDIDMSRLLAEICNEIEILWKQVEINSSEEILNQWRKHSITLGKQVAADLADRRIEGTAEDINDTGALVVRMADGQRVTLTAGEVQLRLLDGSYC